MSLRFLAGWRISLQAKQRSIFCVLFYIASEWSLISNNQANDGIIKVAAYIVGYDLNNPGQDLGLADEIGERRGDFVEMWKRQKDDGKDESASTVKAPD